MLRIQMRGRVRVLSLQSSKSAMLVDTRGDGRLIYVASREEESRANDTGIQ